MPANRFAVCSWSLRPASPAELTRDLAAAGISAVQLALDPLRTGQWNHVETMATLADADIRIVSGMMTTLGEDYTTLDSIRDTGGVRPDQHWEANLAAASHNATLARELEIELVTLHAGFIPHQRHDPLRATMIERLRTITDTFDEQGVRIAFETGQETADTLLDVLEQLDRPRVGVNFDPANMILYDMGDPVEALRSLSPCVAQLHIKDAIRTKTPGQWGTEVPVGAGDVDWDGFFSMLRTMERPCDLVIEREAGDARVEDVRTARTLIEHHMSRP